MGYSSPFGDLIKYKEKNKVKLSTKVLFQVRGNKVYTK